MKRMMFMLAALTALASCSKDDTLTEEETYESVADTISVNCLSDEMAADRHVQSPPYNDVTAGNAVFAQS